MQILDKKEFLCNLLIGSHLIIVSCVGTELGTFSSGGVKRTIALPISRDTIITDN
jgi:hypothetical protein